MGHHVGRIASQLSWMASAECSMPCLPDRHFRPPFLLGLPFLRVLLSQSSSWCLLYRHPQGCPQLSLLYLNLVDPIVSLLSSRLGAFLRHHLRSPQRICLQMFHQGLLSLPFLVVPMRWFPEFSQVLNIGPGEVCAIHPMWPHPLRPPLL